MPRTIDDELIAELNSLIVPDGKHYISVYDSKVAGFIVRKSNNGVVTYAIEFKDYSNNRKTIKIGNSKMKPAVARSVASSLLKQKLKDRRLKSLNKDDLVEVEVKKEVVAIAEKDVADIASSFFNNKQKEDIVIKELDEKPESFDVVIPNESNNSENGFVNDIVDNKDNYHEDTAPLDNGVVGLKLEKEKNSNVSQKEDLFKEQLDPFSKAIFDLKYIGSDNDSKFRSDIIYQIDKNNLDFVVGKYISIFEENKRKYQSHQIGRAVTLANKFLLSFRGKNEVVDNTEKNDTIKDNEKKDEFSVVEKEKMIQSRF